MAGHSKWSNIKFRKKSQDNKRCKIFNKISNEIIQAASSSDLSSKNSKLKMVINKALSFNMPKKNIEKAIERGRLNSKMEDKTLEGFHNNGIFIIVHYEIRINKKIESEIKNIFDKNNSSLAKKCSYSYIVDKGYTVKIRLKDRSAALSLLKNYEVKNIDNDSEYFTFDIINNDINHILSCFKNKKIDIVEKKLNFFFKNKIGINEENKILFCKFINDIKKIQGVKNVFYNIE